MRASHSWQAAWLLFAILAAGCGTQAPHGDKPWCQTRITVRNGAEPLTQAEAVLVADASSGGVDAAGELDAEGTIAIPVLPGNYTLVVRPLPPSQEEMDQSAGSRKPKPAASPIPARFHTAATSPYKVEVIKGTKPVLTFDLAAPAP